MYLKCLKMLEGFSLVIFQQNKLVCKPSQRKASDHKNRRISDVPALDIQSENI